MTHNELPINKVLQGDCINVLQNFPEKSIECVVTDPQYGLEFMGLDWDKSLPPKEAFKETIRVMKPGALCFVMSSPRQDLLWRMLAMLEDVGFELKQSYLEWLFKTGFPKAYDISKAIDERLGEEREVISEHPNPNATGWVTQFKASESKESVPITAPASKLAEKWEGWKNVAGLKPAHEPILMVQKPLSEPTIVDNILKWGVGGINVDGCRVPLTDGGWERSTTHIDDIRGNNYNQPSNPKLEVPPQKAHSKGRFPANLLVSDKTLDTGEITRSSGGVNEGTLGERVYGEFENKTIGDNAGGLGDEGDQSRYFDLDAWALEKGFCDTPKPSKSERDFGLSGDRRNTHPTVKPIKLFAYLIELGCPKNGVVLDPFVGSGTTCIAAKKLARKYIGIELKPEYHRIALQRTAAYPVPLDWLFAEDD